jgi:hypothetical protein
MRLSEVDTFVWSLVEDAMRQRRGGWVRSGMCASGAYLYIKPSSGAVPGAVAVMLEDEEAPAGFELWGGQKIGYGLPDNAAKSMIHTLLQRAPVLAVESK